MTPDGFTHPPDVYTCQTLYTSVLCVVVMIWSDDLVQRASQLAGYIMIFMSAHRQNGDLNTVISIVHFHVHFTSCTIWYGHRIILTKFMPGTVCSSLREQGHPLLFSTIAWTAGFLEERTVCILQPSQAHLCVVGAQNVPATWSAHVRPADCLL